MNDLVLDTSTLILLAKIDLLGPLADRVNVVIPKTVRQEALRKKELMDAQMIYRLIGEGKIRAAQEKESRQALKLALEITHKIGEHRKVVGH